MKNNKTVSIVGGGLAGCEAAWQLAKRGINVRIYEMRPDKMTPAHKTNHLAEMVCSNSLGGAYNTTPAGILKDELSTLGSLLIECANVAKVPAGNALAVDREKFSSEIEKRIENCSRIEIVREEISKIPDGPVILATGPLTSKSLAKSLQDVIGDDFLYFYDAVAPIVSLDSIDFEKSFRGNRYGETGDYINCPMSEEEYNVFWNELVNAECAPRHDFEEDVKHFDGCLPVEVIAKRGPQTLVFGPLRPVGLSRPGMNEEHYAVVQLRQDNKEGTMYNLVGFQTNLKWGEQERVFSLIPALKNAEFVRKGVMHRNLFVCAPNVLDNQMRLINNKKVFLAGQITGVEGYVESIASGLATALCVYSELENLPPCKLPEVTAIGSLINYLMTSVTKSFQPMNVNLGIFPKLPGKKIRKRRERCIAYANRSMEALKKFITENPDLFPEQEGV